MIINVAYFDKNLNLPYIYVKAKRVYFEFVSTPIKNNTKRSDLTNEAREQYSKVKL